MKNSVGSGPAFGCAWLLFAASVVGAQTPPPAPGPAATKDVDAAAAVEPRVNTSAPAGPATQPADKPRATSATGTSTRNPARTNSDRIDLENTQITGNRELPKVLYIVPWKRPELGDMVGRPLNSLLDEVLAPVDRDVFRRENRYFDALQTASPTGDKVSTTPAAAPAGAPPVGTVPNSGSEGPPKSQAES